jgi:hypothetical protein
MMSLPSRVVISLTFLTDSAEMRALPILPARAHALQQSTLMKISVVRPPDVETRSLLLPFPIAVPGFLCTLAALSTSRRKVNSH